MPYQHLLLLLVGTSSSCLTAALPGSSSQGLAPPGGVPYPSDPAFFSYQGGAPPQQPWLFPAPPNPADGLPYGYAHGQGAFPPPPAPLAGLPACLPAGFPYWPPWGNPLCAFPPPPSLVEPASLTQEVVHAVQKEFGKAEQVRQQQGRDTLKDELAQVREELKTQQQLIRQVMQGDLHQHPVQPPRAIASRPTRPVDPPWHDDQAPAHPYIQEVNRLKAQVEALQKIIAQTKENAPPTPEENQEPLSRDQLVPLCSYAESDEAKADCLSCPATPLLTPAPASQEVIPTLRQAAASALPEQAQAQGSSGGGNKKKSRKKRRGRSGKTAQAAAPATLLTQGQRGAAPSPPLGRKGCKKRTPSKPHKSAPLAGAQAEQGPAQNTGQGVPDSQPHQEQPAFSCEEEAKADCLSCPATPLLTPAPASQEVIPTLRQAAASALPEQAQAQGSSGGGNKKKSRKKRRGRSSKTAQAALLTQGPAQDAGQGALDAPPHREQPAFSCEEEAKADCLSASPETTGVKLPASQKKEPRPRPSPKGLAQKKKNSFSSPGGKGRNAGRGQAKKRNGRNSPRGRRPAHPSMKKGKGKKKKKGSSFSRGKRRGQAKKKGVRNSTRPSQKTSPHKALPGSGPTAKLLYLRKRYRAKLPGTQVLQQGDPITVQVACVFQTAFFLGWGYPFWLYYLTSKALHTSLSCIMLSYGPLHQGGRWVECPSPSPSPPPVSLLGIGEEIGHAAAQKALANYAFIFPEKETGISKEKP